MALAIFNSKEKKDRGSKLEIKEGFLVCTLLCWLLEVWVSVSPSLSEGLLESLEDTLTESMLSPELPVGGERGVSLMGELAVFVSAPRKSLKGGGSQLLLKRKYIHHNNYLLCEPPIRQSNLSNMTCQRKRL